MKKLLTFMALCLISTFAFAKTDVLSKPKNIEIVKSTLKFDFEKYNLEVKQDIVYDEQQYSCTATYNINIVDSETGLF